MLSRPNPMPQALASIAQLAALPLLLACSQRIAPSSAVISGLRVNASVQRLEIGPSRGFIAAKAKLLNLGIDTIRFAVGGCPLTIHAYPADVRNGRAVWSSAKVARACPDVRRSFYLATGDSLVLEDSYAVDLVASSGLTPGRYAFTVSIGFLSPVLASPEYPAGLLTTQR